MPPPTVKMPMPMPSAAGKRAIGRVVFNIQPHDGLHGGVAIDAADAEVVPIENERPTGRVEIHIQRKIKRSPECRPTIPVEQGPSGTGYGADDTRFIAEIR